MAEATAKEEPPEPFDLLKWSRGLIAFLEDAVSIPKKHWPLILALLAIAVTVTWWFRDHYNEEKLAAKDSQIAEATAKIEQVRLEGLRKLSDAEDANRVLKRQNTDFAQQVAELKRDKKALEETELREPPQLQLTQAEFLRKAEMAEDSPAQEQFRRDCSNKTIVNWTGTFAGTVEAPATSKNRAVRVEFDKGAYAANCYLSNPDRITGFAQTPIGTAVTITKGTIEKVNFAYVQMARCEVVR